MGVMDQVREGMASPGSSPFLKADEKDVMVTSHQPFNVTGVRYRTNPRYPDQKTGQPRGEWLLDLVFLDTAGNIVEMDDGEGNRAAINRTLVFTATDYRNAEMPRLKAYVEQQLAAGQHYGVGPLMLIKQRVANQPNAAYMLADFDGQVGASPAAAPVPEAPAAPTRPVSPDGRYEWDGTAWVPVQQAPPPPAPIPPPPPTAQIPPPPPAVLPAASVLPFSAPEAGQAPSASGLPPVGVAQPLPPSRHVVGSDGEGGSVGTEQVDGTKMRQVIYQGDGVIQTPQGGLVQAATPEPPPPPAPQIISPDGRHMLVNGAWVELPPNPAAPPPPPPPPAAIPPPPPPEVGIIPAEGPVEGRGIAQEAAQPPSNVLPLPPPPPPVAGPVQEVPVAEIPANETAKKKVIPFQARCQPDEKFSVGCGKTVKGSAFKDSKGRWIISHKCDALDPTTGRAVGSRVIDVTTEIEELIKENV